MGNISDLWAKIVGEDGIIETVWPEVDLIATADQVDRVNWRELLDNLEQAASEAGILFKTPFVVAQFGVAVESSDNPVVTTENHVQPIALHYIRKNVKTEEELTSEACIADILLAKLETMRDALKVGGHGSFQLLHRPSLDASDNNPCNLIFLDGNHPLQAGTISFMAETWH